MWPETSRAMKSMVSALKFQASQMLASLLVLSSSDQDSPIVLSNSDQDTPSVKPAMIALTLARSVLLVKSVALRLLGNVALSTPVKKTTTSALLFNR